MAGLTINPPTYNYGIRQTSTAPPPSVHIDAAGRAWMLSGDGKSWVPSGWSDNGGGGAGGSYGTGSGGFDFASALRDIRGAAGSGPTIPAPGAPAPISGPTPAADQPSRSLGFARAKDNAGRIGASALRALRSQMTERGIEGSDIEGRLTAGVLGDVARGTAEAEYQQAREADSQAWEAAKLGYQGAIGQRGQDIGVGQAGYQGQIQQRGQDQAWMSLAPTILSILSRARY